MTDGPNNEYSWTGQTARFIPISIFMAKDHSVEAGYGVHHARKIQAFIATPVACNGHNRIACRVFLPSQMHWAIVLKQGGQPK